MRIACAVMVLAVMTASGQATVSKMDRDLPPTAGQLRYRIDEANLQADIKHNAPTELLLKDYRQLDGDAQLMNADLTEIAVKRYNASHPEHQYADMQDTINVISRLQKQLGDVLAQYRKSLGY